MYFGGSLKLGGAGAGVLFISLEGKQLKYVLQILWQATNNEAEYETLIHGLRIATSLGIKLSTKAPNQSNCIKKIFTRQEGNNQKGDYKINGSRIYKRNSSSTLASDPVLVQKKNTKEWRMCVDYTDLNKHCPKDPIGLP
jgi:ribonuclease HI